MRRTVLLLACAFVLAGPAAAGAQASLGGTLGAYLNDAGGASGGLVVDLNTGHTLFSVNPDVGRPPASVEKIYTTSTAVVRFGANGNLTTRVLGVGRMEKGGAWHGTLYLKGGGDPTFGSSSYDNYAYGGGATVQRLVSNLIHSTGIKSVHGRIVGDESYFDTVRGTIATGYAISTDVEGELSGLAYNRGLNNAAGTSFQAAPALFAARSFANALRSAHVSIAAGTHAVTGRAPHSARTLGTVHSPRMSTLIRLTNTPSDNFFAEMLLKDLGARFGGRGTSAAGAAVVRKQLARSFRIHPRLYDGSGLSYSDSSSPREVVDALTKLSGNRAFVDSLAVAGETGTIQSGLAGTPAQGRCRGKTGTLSDVANLVGYCTARDGHELVFAFLMNSVDSGQGHSLEYDMAVDLARYDG